MGGGGGGGGWVNEYVTVKGRWQTCLSVCAGRLLTPVLLLSYTHVGHKGSLQVEGAMVLMLGGAGLRAFGVGGQEHRVCGGSGTF